MGDPRKPFRVLLLRIPGKKNVKIELYDASLFEQSRAGQVRIRIDGRWADPSYLTREELTKWLECTLLEDTTQLEPAPRPDLPKGSRVRVRNGNQGPDGPMYDVCFTRTPPFRGPDNRWYVFVGRFANSDEPVACEELEIG